MSASIVHFGKQAQLHVINSYCSISSRSASDCTRVCRGVFTHSVVLILEHQDKLGSIGLILNVLTPMLVSDVAANAPGIKGVSSGDAKSGCGCKHARALREDEGWLPQALDLTRYPAALQASLGHIDYFMAAPSVTTRCWLCTRIRISRVLWRWAPHPLPLPPGAAVTDFSSRSLS